MLAWDLVQQGSKKAVVSHQQGGPVVALQAQGSSRCQEQAHQFGVCGGGGHSQQFHAALQLLTHPLTAAISNAGAEGGTCGPKTKRPRALGHARARSPGN